MSEYYCSHCGSAAVGDSRGGSMNYYLTCGCDEGEWINDGRGGYFSNPTGATLISRDEYEKEIRRLKRENKDMRGDSELQKLRRENEELKRGKR